MSIPSAGPGFHHETAYLYQLPVHTLVLAGWYKLTGIGLWEGRLLSLLMAACCLGVMFSFMRRYGTYAMVVAFALAAFDPVFSTNARTIRYDWVAILGVILAFIILNPRILAPGSIKLPTTRYLAAGICCGLAVGSHLLYVLLIPIFSLMIFLFPLDTSESIKERIKAIFILGIGSLIGLLPVFIYLLNHSYAIKDQLIFQLTQHGQAETGFAVIQWFKSEFRKYTTYYRFIPAVLLFIIVSLAGMVYLHVFRKNGAEDSLPDLTSGDKYPNRKQVDRRMLFVAIILPLALAFVSGHHVHHHLLVVSFWAITCGMFVSYILSVKKRLIRYTLMILGILAVTNGFLAIMAGRTYNVVQSWGTRDISRFYPALTEIIPSGSSVYGNYQLIFLAEKEKWDYIGQYYAIRSDPEQLAEEKFNYVVLSSRDMWPSWLDSSRFGPAVELPPYDPPFKLPSVNRDNIRTQLNVYRFNDSQNDMKPETEY